MRFVMAIYFIVLLGVAAADVFAVSWLATHDVTACLPPGRLNVAWVAASTIFANIGTTFMVVSRYHYKKNMKSTR